MHDVTRRHPAKPTDPTATGSPGRPRWRSVLAALRHPRLPGERAAVATARARLPATVRDEPTQFIGQHTVGCGATWGVLERCQFACTACYLDEDANDTPPLPLAEVLAQLDALRAHLGPWGNVQITSGEVTLLPVEHLLAILRHCRRIELVPMLMTNGEVWRDRPGDLERLVREGGLFRIATHVDTTQRGRRGMRPGALEADLHPLREAFAGLIRATREATGRPLQAAHTVTVTPDNLDQLPDLLRFLLRHVDAWRMVSFQPAAAVGRTRADPLGRSSHDPLWERIEAGIGRRLNRKAIPFGHEDCTSITALLVVTLGGTPHVVETIRAGSRLDARFLARLLRSPLAGYNPLGQPRRLAAAQFLGRLARDPLLALLAPAWFAWRVAVEGRLALRLAATALSGRAWSLRPLTIVVHRFMDGAQLATERGRERLAACTFRLPVDGELVSMCELNATDRRRALGATLRERQRARPRHPVLEEA